MGMNILAQGRIYIDLEGFHLLVHRRWGRFFLRRFVFLQQSLLGVPARHTTFDTKY